MTLLSLALLALSPACRTKDGVLDSDPVAGDDTGELVDADGDGVPASEDCDDDNAGVYPGAVELCDGWDNNCDGAVDEGVTITAYADVDGDGYGDEETATEVCALEAGQVGQGGDCDDSDAAYNPAAAEDDCSDPNDYNCDGSVGYADNDGDGFAACEECDDANPYVNPGAAEVCNDVDDDCDGLIDDADDSLDASSGQTFYADGDGDGYGAPLNTAEACEAPEGYVSDNTDCDDGEAAVYPGATELCNGVDDDCDGDSDEPDAADAASWYADGDGDSYGDASSVEVSCEQPSGYVADDQDCDDGDAAVNPGATELCNSVDDDCDGAADEADAADAATWYADSDGDGYGDASSDTLACDQPSSYVSDDTDCDDGDAGVNPGALEVCSGVDEDCDGVVDDLGPSDIRAGDTSSGQSRHYQYSSVASGAGELEANWSAEPNADGYELAVGSTAGAEDVLGWTGVGSGTSATLSGLSLTGAWEGAEYYISVRAVNGSTACDLSATSEAVQIAEAATWTGDVADLRAPDAYGGYSTDWPESGVDAVYGAHYFEEVDIGASTTVMVQGWGAVDGVASGVSASDAAVTDPADGWIALYANDIRVAGMITASGRGYGGGAGGGGGVRGGVRGYGGDGGLGGDGGPGATSYAGGGGGGSPGGQGGVGAYTGGAGNLYGGGSGATGCSGAHGRDGGDGSVGSVGGTGGTASSAARAPRGR
ncbi:MAG: putative metal-binding motif-containing protein [Alphaproteobacteria bacterium]|nr:putative metal-binding motif-containing protein [Alphaproteobacteria bacterium]